MLITPEKLRAMDYARLADLEQNASRLKTDGGPKCSEASSLLEAIAQERARRAAGPAQLAGAPTAANRWHHGYVSADECRSRLAVSDWGAGVATYVLWDRRTGEPVYCGTARNRSRIDGHLKKDDLRNATVGTTARNPELRAYCLAQPRGWLGVAFRLFPSEAEAKREEQGIIASFGIRRQGGKLFNQRTSG